MSVERYVNLMLREVVSPLNYHVRKYGKSEEFRMLLNHHIRSHPRNVMLNACGILFEEVCYLYLCSVMLINISTFAFKQSYKCYLHSTLLLLFNLDKMIILYYIYIYIYSRKLLKYVPTYT